MDTMSRSPVHAAIGDGLGNARDPHLVVIGVELAEFNARVGGNLGSLAVAPQIGDIGHRR